MKRLFPLLATMLLISTTSNAFFFRLYDSEAEKWARVQIPASGGTLSGTAYIAATRFMQQVKWWGVRGRLGRVNLYLGNQTNALLCPIIYDWTDATATNDDLIAFVAGDYSESTGLTGNTTTKYLRPSKGSGVNIAAFTDNRNLHLANYIRTGSSEVGICMGIAYAGTANWAVSISRANSSTLFAGLNINAIADTNGVGFYCNTRTLTNNAVLWKNGAALITDSADDSGAVGSGALVVHAFNSAGSIVANTARTLSYYGIGYGIPASLINPYTIAVQNVQQALGRKVP